MTGEADTESDDDDDDDDCKKSSMDEVGFQGLISGHRRFLLTCVTRLNLVRGRLLPSSGEEDAANLGH